MAHNHSANQFDRSYKPSRLGNWEVPKSEPKSLGKTRTLAGEAVNTTRFIVDEKGHLLDRSKKGSAFAVSMAVSSRWPEKQGLSNDTYPGAATMGYKGVATDFLPISTIHAKTVPGTREYPYAQPI
ncbi:hypothetical protein T492DRAFT_919481 [Pavlovales sp. CCMP2436]|nr:hypothetical protein T492DRAFT_919481 [Pavlovales sp. CCMP2436]